MLSLTWQNHMKFTFFKRRRVLLPISKKANREFNALSRTELAKLPNFSLFFRGIGGRLDVIWTFGFFGKIKARWNILFPFLKIVHQNGLLGRIKWIMKFCNCRRILDIYSQCLLKGQCPDYAHARASSVFSSKDNRTVKLTRQGALSIYSKFPEFPVRR